MSNVKHTDGDEVTRLLSIMAKLRDPDFGCPWDLQQTMSTLTRYTIEEAYEVVDAIVKGNPKDICDELGDLLFQIVFYAQLANESGFFDFNDVVTSVNDKMVRRHPHVFSNVKVDADALSLQWEKIKAEEKAQGPEALSILDTVPVGFPALMYAQKLQKQCAKVGFDWPDISPVMDKVREEVEEVQQELDRSVQVKSLIEEEIGDALFAMVNLARHCQIDADSALRNASNKFATRFRQVESLAIEQGNSVEELSLEEMELLWQRVKRHSHQ